MQLIDPYTEIDECLRCAKHGTPCIPCADDAHGTKGPGFRNGIRVLPLVHLDPNICRTMIYWWNAHPREIVAILQAALPGVSVVENMFDVNVAALGMLGRSHLPTLSTDHNVITMFFDKQ
jgi:hypothetical protein